MLENQSNLVGPTVGHRHPVPVAPMRTTSFQRSAEECVIDHAAMSWLVQRSIAGGRLEREPGRSCALDSLSSGHHEQAQVAQEPPSIRGCNGGPSWVRAD